jgi:hypothetical protein
MINASLGTIEVIHTANMAPTHAGRAALLTHHCTTAHTAIYGCCSYAVAIQYRHVGFDAYSCSGSGSCNRASCMLLGLVLTRNARCKRLEGRQVTRVT